MSTSFNWWKKCWTHSQWNSENGSTISRYSLRTGQNRAENRVGLQARSAPRPRSLVLGVFQGVPATQKSVFDLSTGPNRIVLYQKNIEAVCRNEAEIRHEVRQTVLHELGHYFGMNESQLKDV